jgi:hypothetical protein
MVMNLKDVFNGMFVDKNGRTVGQQLDLLTIGAYRKNDPDTSKEAAKSITTDLEQVVLDCLKTFPDGATMDQIVDALGMPAVSVSPRFAPLLRKKLIIDTGERRKGLSGRSQRVLKSI